VVVADPSAELLDLIRSMGDPPPRTAPPAMIRRADLIRRRFGLALPAPFIDLTVLSLDDEPMRIATAFDGTGIAAVKYRAYGTNFRGGVMPDAFLDHRDIVPPASFWTGRAMVPPSRQHRLLVWGGPGRVLGYVDCGPAHPEDVDPADIDAGVAVGEVYELYVDPSVQGRGGGARLLAAATDALADGRFEKLELNVLTTNVAAQRFYEQHGWEPTGRITHCEFPQVAFDEARFTRRLVGGA